MLSDPAYWRRVIRDASKQRWSHFNARGPAMCLPVIAAWFFIGVVWHHRTWSVYAVAGAVSASFGAFQKLGKSRTWPMVILLAGIAVGTFVGNVAGYFGWYWWVIVATLCGFGFGAMTTLGYGAWWLGLQWIIAVVVYGSHAAHPRQALENAIVVVLGGASQLVFLKATCWFCDAWFPAQEQPPLDPVDSLRAQLLRNANPVSAQGHYALRVALAMAGGTIIWHVWGLPNGYWTPMTAAILLKPDFHEATLRAVNRLVGTLIGAGLMTIVLAFIRPGSAELGCLLLLAIWLCLALMRVNYGLFVACVTAYVVLLFSTLGLPEPIIALHRVEATLAGAAVALAVSLFPSRPHPDPATT